MESAPDNPKGFFESRLVVNLNDHILRAIGARWDSIPSHVGVLGFAPEDPIAWAERTFAREVDRVLSREYDVSEPHSVIKDPRLCILLPLWEASARRLGFDVSHLFVLRDPEEVSRSLWRRDKMSSNRSETLWGRYNAHALVHLPDNVPIIRFADMMSKPNIALEQAGVSLTEDQSRAVIEFASRPNEPKWDGFRPRPGARSHVIRNVLSAVGDGARLPDREQRHVHASRALHLLRVRDETDGNLFRLGPPRPSEPTQSGHRNVIFHCHLFKNAGTSVDHVLKSAFGEAWNEQEFPGADNFSNADMVLSHIVANSKYTVFSSHTGNWFTGYETPRLNVFPIIFLRHPILRILSAYQFERKQETVTAGSKLAKSTDLAGYIRQRLDTPYDYALTNFQARRLAFFVSRHVVDVRGQALDAFDALDFIGRVEDFSGSMERMEAYLKPHFPDFEAFATQKNVTSGEVDSIDTRMAKIRDEIGDELSDKLVDANQIDLELFDRLEARYASA